MPELGWFLATVIGAVVFGTGGFIIKLGSNSHPKAGTVVLLGLYSVGSICFAIAITLQQGWIWDPLLVIAGMFIGLGSVFGNFLWVRAFDYGPASLTGPVINTYNVLVIFIAIGLYGETLGLKEIIGIAIILIALGLLNYDPNEQLRIKNKVWFGLVGLAIFSFFMRSGGLKIAEENGINNTLLLAFGYPVGIVWFGSTLVRAGRSFPYSVMKKPLALGMLAGLFSFGGLQLFTYALERGPASIISPIFAMNGMIFALLTIITLKERISQYQTMALIGCVAGLVLIRI
jgi:uncharacterized membrane protein